MEIVDGVDFIAHVRQEGARRPDLHIETSVAHSASCQPTESFTLSENIPSGELGRADTQPRSGDDRAVPPSQQVPVDQHVDLGRLHSSLIQLWEALTALHSVGIVHRDLEPSNVRVTNDGRLVLMDFGIIAELTHHSGSHLERGIIGTPAYMAPEQATGIPSSAAADWYAMGVMLYLALTGRLPFVGLPGHVLMDKQHQDPHPVSLFVTGVPDELESLCMRLLARDPAMRLSAAEILATLEGKVMLRPQDTGMSSIAGLEVFVGRNRELAALEGAYRVARHGSHRCVAITGPSGIGKSTMISRFLHRRRRADPLAVLLSGYCHERETLPYKALDSIVDELSSVLLGLTGQELATVLPPGVGALSRLFPTLERVRGCAAGQDFDGRDPLEVRSAAVDALRAIFRELARKGPVLLCIEDLQWADRDNLDLLRQLLRAPIPCGLLVLLSVRTHYDASPEGCLAPLLDALEAQGSLDRIALGPLSDDEQRQLVHRLTGQSATIVAPDPSFWHEAGGHPMLLSELAHVAGDGASAVAPGSLDLEQILWRRIAALDDAPRALVHAIALAGVPLPLRLCADACGLADAERERAWSFLRLERLARQVSRADHHQWVAVYHDKIRETIAEHLAAEEMARLHGKLALAMESWGEASASALAITGSRPAIADVEYDISSRQQGPRRHSWPWMERPSCIAPRSRSCPGLAATGTSSGCAVSCWVGLAEGMRITEQGDRALELLESAESAAVAHQLADVLAALHLLRGNLLFPTGKTDACLAEHQRARQFARAVDSIELEARALGGMGDAFLMSARMLSAFEHYDGCVRLCREHRLTGIELANLPQRAWTGMYRNQLAQALDDARYALREVQRIGHRRAEVFANAHLSMILTEMACLDEAGEAARQAVELPRELGMSRFVISHTPLLARVLIAQGQRDEAEALLREGLERSRDSDLLFSGPLQLGVLALATEDPATRDDALERGAALLRAGALGYNGFFFFRDAMEAMYRVGDPHRLVAYADGLEEFTSQEPTPWSQFFSSWGRGLASHLRDPTDAEVLDELDELRDRANSIGLHLAAQVLSQAIAASIAARRLPSHPR